MVFEMLRSAHESTGLRDSDGRRPSGAEGSGGSRREGSTRADAITRLRDGIEGACPREEPALTERGAIGHGSLEMGVGLDTLGKHCGAGTFHVVGDAGGDGRVVTAGPALHQ